MREHGISLVELIISIGLLGLAILMGIQFFSFGISTYDRGETAAETRSNARLIAEIIEKELKYATEAFIFDEDTDVSSHVNDYDRFIYYCNEDYYVSHIKDEEQSQKFSTITSDEHEDKLWRLQFGFVDSEEEDQEPIELIYRIEDRDRDRYLLEGDVIFLNPVINFSDFTSNVYEGTAIGYNIDQSILEQEYSLKLDTDLSSFIFDSFVINGDIYSDQDTGWIEGFNWGEEVIIDAIYDANEIDFYYWQDGATRRYPEPSYTFTIYENTALTAVFDEGNRVVLDIELYSGISHSANPDEIIDQIELEGEDFYEVGEMVNLTYDKPDELRGVNFIKWYNENTQEEIEHGNFQMPDEQIVNITARFSYDRIFYDGNYYRNFYEQESRDGWFGFGDVYFEDGDNMMTLYAETTFFAMDRWTTAAMGQYIDLEQYDQVIIEWENRGCNDSDIESSAFLTNNISGWDYPQGDASVITNRRFSKDTDSLYASDDGRYWLVFDAAAYSRGGGSRTSDLRIHNIWVKR